MRIIHLGKYYPPATGGIETHTQTLCRSLAARGLSIEVVVVNHQDAGGKDVTFDRKASTPSTTDHDGPITIHRIGRVANVAKLDVTPGLTKLLKQMRQNPPDVWHLHTPNITMMLALATLKNIRPLVITHHSDIVRQKVLKYGVRPLERLIYKRAAAVLPTSAAYAAGSSLLAKMPGKVTPLPLGIDLAPYQQPSANALAYREHLLQTHGPTLWLAVGRLIYYKAIDVAIDALKTVPGKLVVIGTGPSEHAWKEKATALGVADRVVWLGRAPADEVVGAYHAATAYWFPSNARAEGFGLVQVEAMAAGCPVINTAIPASGVAWVSPDGVSGLTVPMNDASALAAAANRLLSEPGLRERLAAGAKARAAAEFDQALMAERCEAVYRGVVTK
jgi:rhamnosyl/mannosyltransferase